MIRNLSYACLRFRDCDVPVMDRLCMLISGSNRLEQPPNGNDRAGGSSSATLTPELKLAWTYKSPAKPEKAWSGSRTTPIEGQVMLPRVTFDASPQIILVDGKAYFGSTVDHRLHCVDAATGKTIWSFYTDGPIRFMPTFAHGNVYFGSDDGKVYCLNARGWAGPLAICALA